MPRAKRQAARRRARLEQERACKEAILDQLVTQAVRETRLPEKGEAYHELCQYLEKVRRSEVRVWDVIGPHITKLQDTIAAMIEELAELKAIAAQAVEPALAGMTPGSVHRRHSAIPLGRRYQVADVEAETNGGPRT